MKKTELKELYQMMFPNYPDIVTVKQLQVKLSLIGNNINQLAVKAHALGCVDAPMLKTEALRWHQFQADVEATFLRPQQSNLKWK